MYISMEHVKPDPQCENKDSSRKLAVITGATSGIGKSFAGYFAAAGYDLLITGRRREAIYEVASELKNLYGVNTEVLVADFSRSADIALLLQVISKQKNIRVLVNNAGYAMDCKFIDDDIGHQMDMLKTHVNVPLMLIHEVLPVMIANHGGIIINVSSLAAFLPIPGNAMYASTKSFLKNFTESLHMDVCSYGIKVQCLCPGFTRSNFHKNSNMSVELLQHGLVQWMRPAEVVNYSIYCLNKGQVVCIPGFLNRVVSLLVTIIPRQLYYLIATRMEKKVRRPVHVPDMTTLQPAAINQSGNGKRIP